jgi:hypothetical protein
MNGYGGGIICKTMDVKENTMRSIKIKCNIQKMTGS